MSLEWSANGVAIGLGLGTAVGFVVGQMWRATARARSWQIAERHTLHELRTLCDLAGGVGGRLRGLSDQLEQRSQSELASLPSMNCASANWALDETRSVARYLDDVCRQIELQVESLDDQAKLMHADVATGLANREAFSGLLQQRLREQRPDESSSVLMIEIDSLARIRSQFGHKAELRVVRQVAETLVETLRAKDVIARCGEGCFAALLPDVALVDAQLAGERLRRMIAARVAQVEQRAIALAASIGVVSAMPGDNAMALIGRAQSAMTAARSAGGNVVYLHTGSQCRPLDESSSFDPSPTAPLDLRSPPAPDMLGPQLTAIGVDAATGLPTRATFLDTVRDTIADRRHRPVALSLMLVAIDDLTQLHDQYGGVAGEALLRVITQLIRSTTRATFDRLGLYTHDTIGVLLVDASLDEAMYGAERLRRALANCRLRDGGRDLSVRATIGVAELATGGDSNTLLASAVAALDIARRGDSPIGFQDSTNSQARKGCEAAGV